MKEDKRNKKTVLMEEPPTRNYPKAYLCWSDMFKRCYCQKWLQKHPTYIHTEVCDEWCIFDNFLIWYQANYTESWHLDKDVLVGSNLYSPDTCCFLPPYLNRFLVGKTSTGVVFRDGKYVAQISNHRGRNNYYRYFETYEAAKNFYYNAKKEKAVYLLQQYELGSKINEGVMKFVDRIFK